MSSWLLIAQLDDDRGGLFLFLLFVVLPLVLRLLRWLGVRLGLLRPETPAAEVQESDPRAELRRRRAERRAAESEGEDLWKRLARGEVAEAPPAPVVLPVPARERSSESALEPEPSEVHAESLEREEEPAPLSMLGEVFEPGQAPEVSLESEAEPAPLGALEAGPLSSPESVARRPVRGFGALARDDWRRAIVLSEVLGPPVSERMRA